MDSSKGTKVDSFVSCRLTSHWKEVKEYLKDEYGSRRATAAVQYNEPCPRACGITYLVEDAGQGQ